MTFAITRVMLVCPSTHLSVGIFEFLSLYSLDTHSTSLLFLQKQILCTILFMYVFHKRCVVFVRRRATLLKVKIIFNSIKKVTQFGSFWPQAVVVALAQSMLSVEAGGTNVTQLVPLLFRFIVHCCTVHCTFGPSPWHTTVASWGLRTFLNPGDVEIQQYPISRN